MHQSTTDPDEQFRLDVDSLEAALRFDDYPAARRELTAQKGEAYAQRAIFALAERLIEQGRAA